MKNTLRTEERAAARRLANRTAIVALDSDPGALLPYLTTSAASTDVQGFLYQQLAELSPDLATYEPRLARRWEWLDDHRVLEVSLRSGLRWSDGAPLTSADVQFTFQIARDPRLGWGGATYKSRIRECRIVDAHTVRFHFTESYPDQFLDANAGFIVPKHRLAHRPPERWGESEDARRPVGCGAFTVGRWERARLDLVRNPHYFEAPLPRLDSVRLEVVPDPEERVRALCRGSVDLLPQVPERHAARLRDAARDGVSNVQIHSIRGRQYDFVCYNPRHPALGRRAVRRALTLAADRATIIHTLCSGFAEPFESPIVPILWAYDTAAPLTPYDPCEARRVLERDGWQEPCHGEGVRMRQGVRLEFELVTNAESERRTGAARLLADSWRAIGARVHVCEEARAAVLERLDARRFEAALSGWRARLKPDLEPMWGCSSVGGKTNRVDYCNPEVDELNAEALRTHDLAEAQRLFQTAQRLVAADHPYTWLYYLHDVVGWSWRLCGATFDARGVFLNPQEWHIASGDP